MFPAKIIVSAKLAPNSSAMGFNTSRVLDNLEGSLDSQLFCGDKAILAPLAPPLKSDPLNDLALSHATVIRSEIDNPDWDIFDFKADSS